MKNNKKFTSAVASVAIASQLLPISSTIAYAQTNNITNVISENKFKAYDNRFDIYGENGRDGFEISFDVNDPNNKRIKVKVLGDCGEHKISETYGGKEFIKLEIVDQDGKPVEKGTVILKGEDTIESAMRLNNFEFQYNYGLRISHAQGGSRVKISGDIINLPVSFKTGVDKEILEKVTFFFRDAGLEYRESVTNANDITLTGSTYEGLTNQFTINFNNRDKKIKITSSGDKGHIGEHPFNPAFKDEVYITLTLFDKDGNKKQSVSLKGNDDISVITDVFNDLDFEYGDILKIYHAEAGKHVTISGYVDDQVKYGIYDLDKGISEDVLSQYSFRINEYNLQFIKDANK